MVVYDRNGFKLTDLCEYSDQMGEEFMFKPCCSAVTSTSCNCSSSSILTTCCWSNNPCCTINQGCT